MTDKDIENIYDICKKHCFADYYCVEDIPEKKYRNAVLNFPIPLELGNDGIIALIDSTIFGSCKTGLAICASGIYWKNDWSTNSNENHLSWKKFKKADIVRNETTVQLGSGNLFYTLRRIEVTKLLKDLQNNLKGDFFGNAESFFDNADKKIDQVNGFVGKALSFLDNLGTSLEELADKFPEENKVIEVKEIHQLTDSTKHVAIEEVRQIPDCPPPLPQLEMWHIAINGQQEGPFDTSTIKNLITKRNIDKTKCYVWKKGMADWKLMSEVGEFEDKKDVPSNLYISPPKTYGTNYGDKLNLGDNEIYYTSNVTKAEVQALGNYLVEEGFYGDEQNVSIQLDKDGDTYLFRMVVKYGFEKDKDTINIMKGLCALLLEDVFINKKVNVQLCDSKFRTLRTIVS